MSRVIKLTSEYIAECTKEFEASLKEGKFADGKISFSKTLGIVSRRAKVYFTDMAWMKMQMLIREFESEVAWHGVAFRGEDESKDEYYITDILVYPQEVSGAEVEMDVSKYEEWLRENIEDERFFNIGMQGHSHVRMNVSPSGTDLSHQKAILDQLTEDMFYIFMIWNKFGDKNIKIYDLAKNVLFETTDVDTEVLTDGYGIDAFIKEAKNVVENKTYGVYRGYNETSAVDVSTRPSKDNTKDTSTGSKLGKRKGKKKNSKSKGAYGSEDWRSTSKYYA